MTTCGDSFWFWFMRPIAETLGGLAMVLGFAVIVGLVLFVVTRRKP